MTECVAVVKINGDYDLALRNAIELIGGIADLNTSERDVTLKIGIFDPRSQHHASPGLVRATAAMFDRSPSVVLAESDNYCGKSIERMQTCYGGVLDERLTPYDLSCESNLSEMMIAGEEMGIASALLKPNVFVSIHILRSFAMGSALKNLFGCTPMVKKAKYHKVGLFENLLADIYQACGGIDLAVLDGTTLLHSATEKGTPMDILIVGRDAVAVEAVGGMIAGLKPQKIRAISEFTKRGIGEANLDHIEIVGCTSDEIKALIDIGKQFSKKIASAPRQPGISGTIDTLVTEGWFAEERSLVEVAAALKERGVKAKDAVVDTTLKRRTGKSLDRVKGENGWLYKRKQD